MVIDMNVSKLDTIEQIKEFLVGAATSRNGAAAISLLSVEQRPARRAVRVYAAFDRLLTTACIQADRAISGGGVQLVQKVTV